ncbi:MAG: hypothetical protein ABIN37_16000 [Burkholderiaceae bacterium]
MKRNKTLAAWAALLGGVAGLHRFYLKGFGDILGWLLPAPALLGAYGVLRARTFGLDDHWSWILMPLLGFEFSACALTAIVYGLTERQRWNRIFNTDQPLDHPVGATNWLTIAAVVMSVFLGTTALMASIVFSIQRIFEWQLG